MGGQLEQKARPNLKKKPEKKVLKCGSSSREPAQQE
jgi:hypothetical protein